LAEKVLGIYQNHQYRTSRKRSFFSLFSTESGKSTERIMNHTEHQSAAMVRVYTRRADAFADHAGAGLL
jgi:hypothetical protein